MNINIIWTAVSSICTAVSCIVALVLGVYNIVHSRKYEERQRKREIRDKALDAALQLWTVCDRLGLTTNLEDRTICVSQMSGLSAALKAYGYEVNYNLISSSSVYDANFSKELARVIDEIVADGK